MGKAEDYARALARKLEDRAVDNDVLIVNIISLMILQKYPRLSQDARRQIAGKVMEEDYPTLPPLPGDSESL